MQVEYGGRGGILCVELAEVSSANSLEWWQNTQMHVMLIINVMKIRVHVIMNAIIIKVRYNGLDRREETVVSRIGLLPPVVVRGKDVVTIKRVIRLLYIYKSS